MSLAHGHPNPIAVLDAVIADMRASGDTGHVENLLQARADFAELISAVEFLMPRILETKGCICIDRMHAAMDCIRSAP